MKASTPHLYPLLDRRRERRRRSTIAIHYSPFTIHGLRAGVSATGYNAKPSPRPDWRTGCSNSGYDHWICASRFAGSAVAFAYSIPARRQPWRCSRLRRHRTLRRSGERAPRSTTYGARFRRPFLPFLLLLPLFVFLLLRIVSGLRCDLLYSGRWNV